MLLYFKPKEANSANRLIDSFLAERWKEKAMCLQKQIDNPTAVHYHFSNLDLSQITDAHAS